MRKQSVRRELGHGLVRFEGWRGGGGDMEQIPPVVVRGRAPSAPYPPGRRHRVASPCWRTGSQPWRESGSAQVMRALKSSAGHQEVGYLNGILGQGERGLFVCTGGFSNDAKNAAFVRDGRVALVDGTELLDLILQHYERMPARASALLPLRRVYVPEKPVQSV